jgi:hypothetical protein
MLKLILPERLRGRGPLVRTGIINPALIPGRFEEASDEEVLRAIMEVPGHYSFTTGTSAEVMYQNIAIGTQLGNFTTEASLHGGIQEIGIPARYLFTSAGGVGKCLKLRALLRVGATATPTFTYTFRMITSTTWSAAGIAWATQAITHQAVTLAPVMFELDIVCRTVGAGGGTNTTLVGVGICSAGTAFGATGGMFSIPDANQAVVKSIDSSVSQYGFMSAACGTANALNLVQMEICKMWGEN